MNSDGRERRFFVHLRSCAGDEDLKQGTLRGGLAKICAQVRHFLLRVGSLRLTEDHGQAPQSQGFWIGHVTGVNGVVDVFKDFVLR